MGAFEKIKTGLEEAIAYEQGTLEAKTRKTTVQSISHYDAAEIRAIRASTGA